MTNTHYNIKILDMKYKYISARTEFLYAIYCELSNKVKIGITNDVDKRLKALQAYSPTKLKILAVINLPDCLTVEKRLHKLLKVHNSHGEWFTYESEVLNIISLMKQNDVRALRKKVYRKDECIIKNSARIRSYTTLKEVKNRIEHTYS